MKNRCAFTLIELLIVIAMIAIGAAALIATLVAPLKEQIIADAHGEMERGSMIFFTQIVGDVHGAESFDIQNAGTRLDVQPVLRPEWRVVYFLSETGTLRRWEGDASVLPPSGAESTTLGAPLVPSVQELQFVRAEDGATTMSISLLARREVMGQPVAVDRSLTLLANGAWKGAQ